MAINFQIKRPLSAAELIQLTPGVKVVTYDELHNLKNIDDILLPAKKCYILYFNAENYGHWTCIFLDKNVLNFFDSYGGSPDNYKILQNIPIDILERKHQMNSSLSKLMIESRYPKINYNNIRLQGHDSSTCGRFCAVRLMNSNMNDKKFEKYVKSFGVSPDEFVTVYTEELLN